MSKKPNQRKSNFNTFEIKEKKSLTNSFRPIKLEAKNSSEIIRQEIKSQAKAIFDALDKDHDGSISKKEFLYAIKKLVANCKHIDAERVKLGALNIGENDRVNYVQFLSIIESFDASKCDSPEIKEMFAFFDADADGRINFQELKRRMNALGFELDDVHIKDMISVADVNKDGAIDLTEFRKMIEIYKNGLQK